MIDFFAFVSHYLPLYYPLTTSIHVHPPSYAFITFCAFIYHHMPSFTCIVLHICLPCGVDDLMILTAQNRGFLSVTVVAAKREIWCQRWQSDHEKISEKKQFANTRRILLLLFCTEVDLNISLVITIWKLPFRFSKNCGIVRI